MPFNIENSRINKSFASYAMHKTVVLILTFEEQYMVHFAVHDDGLGRLRSKNSTMGTYVMRNFGKGFAAMKKHTAKYHLLNAHWEVSYSS